MENLLVQGGALERRRPVVHRHPAAAGRASESASTDHAGAAASLRQRLGNRGTQLLVDRMAAKEGAQDQHPATSDFKLSQPGDAHELEADRVADAVMRMPLPDRTTGASPTAAGSLSPSAATVHRLCVECEEEAHQQAPTSGALPMVQREAAYAQGGSSPIAPAAASGIRAMQASGGSRLPDTTRTFFGSRFGTDFSHVRIHTDARATDIANALDAQAFTVGKDIVFGAGTYAPDTHEGRQLIAHELVHVVQQSGGNATGGPNLISPYYSAGTMRIQRQAKKNQNNGGCGICAAPAVVGTLAHSLAESIFQLTYGRRIIPEVPIINPQDSENYRLDLIRIITSPTPPTIVEIGEIKPDNDKGRKDGKRDLEFYRRAVQADFPAPLFEVHFMDLPAPAVSLPFTDAPGTLCPTQSFQIRQTKLGGQPGLYLYSCTPPGAEVDKSCCGKTIPIPNDVKQEEKEKKEDKDKKKNTPEAGPVTAPQPPLVNQIAEFIKDLIQTGQDVGIAVKLFLQAYPEIAEYLNVAAISLFLANVVEDIATLGAGLADDPAVISICLALIRAARAIRTVPVY